jgi:hypothetical protein
VRVAVYINENKPVERTVLRSRLDAERVAQLMIHRLPGFAKIDALIAKFEKMSDVLREAEHEW